MSWLKTILWHLPGLFGKGRVERRIEEEFRFHLEMRTQEYVDAGMAPEEALRRARRQFGNLTYITEVSREMWVVRSIETLWQDLRYGLRMLLKNPGFAAVSVLSLALGIGANTAIFSLVDAVLLKMLPVKDPSQLVALDVYIARGERNGISYPMFEQLRARTTVFSGIFAALDGTSRLVLAGLAPGSQEEQAEVQLVSGEYFEVLGVNAVAGRTLTAADNQTPGAHPVAVLSYGFWQRRFAGDVSVIGKSITLKAQPFTIIGVTQPGFFGEAVGRAPDIWAPLMMQPAFERGQSYLGAANRGWLRVMARLQPGVSEIQAQAALTTLLGQIKSEPSEFAKSSSHVSRIGLVAGGQGLSELRDKFAKPLGVLMAAVGLVLLIACANVANLLLARSAARQKEIGIRLALGAGRVRLIRQFLTESLLLASAGGILGLFFAWWGSRILLVLVSGNAAPIPIDVEPNARLLAFTFAVSLSTAFLFGLAPALIATRQEINSALKTIVLARPRLSLSRPLVVAQVALSLLLLAGAGLFVQTLRNLSTLDLGFAAEHIIQARFNPRSSGYKPEQYSELYRQLLKQLNSTPGVRSASLSGSGFRSGTSRTCCIAVEGYTHRADEDREIQIFSVTPGYFQTMELPLLLGRDFTPPEDVSKPNEFPKVAVINETMARFYFGQANPVGRRFGWGDPAQTVKYDTEIVGVVKDANYGNLRGKTRSLIYFPTQGENLLVVRVAGTPAAFLSTIRQEIQAVDKNLEITSIRTVPQILDQALVQEGLLAKLSSFFGLLALLLACIGLYGVMSYDVARRTHEIGVRMALGAPGGAVSRMVLREMLWLLTLGLLFGLAGAVATTKLIESLLFGLAPTDPPTLTLAVLLLLGVATITAWLPARRAARIDPLLALRHE